MSKQEEKSARTPGPWKVFSFDEFRVEGPDGISILSPYRRSAEEFKANAEFIVRACNAHDDLVAALKLAAPHHQGGHSEVGKAICAALEKAGAK